MPTTTNTNFTPYQIFLVATISLALFTVVVDYMTLPALSAVLLTELNITTEQFGLIVSAYAFSAGISGILTAGFADKFDRKKLLAFYYGGFLIGVISCAVVQNLTAFIIARIITGIFGGVVASICFSIVADLFATDQRGRVMGFVQMAFAGSQILGLPAALYVATNFNWQFSFWSIAALATVVLIIIILKINPITDHLENTNIENPLNHIFKTLKSRDYLTVFSNNILLVFGDVMFMTFGSAFATNNLGIFLDDLPLLYGATGVATFIFGPYIGQLSDRFGKLKVFVIGSIFTIILIGIYSHLGNTPFWLVVTLHTFLFMGVNARMISSSALATVVPKASDRGAFMAVDASLQQIASGLAATAAGLVVFQTAEGTIDHYPRLGWLVIGAMLVTIILMQAIQKIVRRAN
ncbi:MAG: MFS transporter [Saprospiraceae bacterium]